ncbi:hypothetical protein Hanom_Chr04g00370321 [Helianthus anomalus]
MLKLTVSTESWSSYLPQHYLRLHQNTIFSTTHTLKTKMHNLKCNCHYHGGNNLQHNIVYSTSNTLSNSCIVFIYHQPVPYPGNIMLYRNNTSYRICVNFRYRLKKGSSKNSLSG